MIFPLFCYSIPKKTDNSSVESSETFLWSSLAKAHNFKWVLSLEKRGGGAMLCYAMLYPEYAGTLHVDSLR